MTKRKFVSKLNRSTKYRRNFLHIHRYLFGSKSSLRLIHKSRYVSDVIRELIVKSEDVCKLVYIDYLYELWDDFLMLEEMESL